MPLEQIRINTQVQGYQSQAQEAKCDFIFSITQRTSLNWSSNLGWDESYSRQGLGPIQDTGTIPTCYLELKQCPNLSLSPSWGQAASSPLDTWGYTLKYKNLNGDPQEDATFRSQHQGRASGDSAPSPTQATVQPYWNFPGCSDPLLSAHDDQQQPELGAETQVQGQQRKNPVSSESRVIYIDFALAIPHIEMAFVGISSVLKKVFMFILSLVSLHPSTSSALL